MTLQTFRSGEALAIAAASLFTRVAREAVAARGSFSVALSGGHTPERLFQILGSAAHRSLAPWEKAHVFWADERLVPPTSCESNFRLAHEHLLSRVPVPESQIHRVPVEEGQGAAAAYERNLREAFSHLGMDGEWPRFDLVLLGLGADGHTASLMPYAAPSPGKWVIEPWVPHLRSFRVSLTEGAINHAREALFTVTGAGKTEAAAAVLEGPSDPERLPAQRIRLGNGRLTWYLDEAAAAGLKKFGATG